MFLNFFLYISENTSGYILAKLGQIVSVLTGETHQMCLTAAHRSCFKAALRNQTQDFFLIDLIILLACKMDQLKNHTVIGHLHFFLVEIDVLFASKSLKGTKHTGIPV